MLHRGRGADQAAEAAEPAQVILQASHVILERAQALDVGERGLEATDVQRLEEVIERAQAQGVDRGVDRGHAGDEDHVAGARFLELTQQVDPVAVGQDEIDDHEIGWRVGEVRPRLGQRARARDSEAFLFRDLGDSGEEVGVVVDDECAQHRPSFVSVVLQE